jgi:RNA polymerase sigma-70 factor (ECF subfamily)
MSTLHTLARLGAATDATPYTLEQVYREHAATVSRWIVRLWGPRDAADVLHEVFLVVQRKLAGFRGECAMTTWLYAITVRVVSSRRRHERWRRLLWARVMPQMSEQRAPVETPQSSIEREQATRMVYSVLDELSERDRTLLILFELEGLEADQIAPVVGMSVDHVWVGLHRARARFRKRFEKRFGPSGEGSSDGDA